MTQTSEYCSQGHPDRVADGIVSYLLDRYLEKDPQSRVAIEAQIKDNHVALGGEVTSTYMMTEDELKAKLSALEEHLKERSRCGSQDDISVAVISAE